MARIPYDEMSKADLLREIRALQAILGDQVSLSEVVHELQVHQEEVKAQEAQLLEAQHALEESRDRYADLFDFAPVGYATLDATGVIRDVNLATGTMLGIERGRLIGSPLLVHVAEDDRKVLLQHLSRCRAGEDAASSNLRFRRRGGGTLTVRLVSRRTDTRVDGTLWNTAILDMSEQERADAERRRAEEERLHHLREEESLRAMAEAKDRFLAMLSHELRTPLTPILFTLSVLERRSDVPSELRAELQMVRRNTEFEARLIDDLLDATRIARGKMHLQTEVVDLHEAINDVLTMCASECDQAGLEMLVETGATAVHVQGDSTRLRQVLWNLVKNAIRHTPAGGRICVRTVNPEPDRVRVVVEDSGVGIEPEFFGRIFEAFQQADASSERSGLGLGLAISKGIVDAHGGSLRAHSEGRDRGARFELELATTAVDDAREESAELHGAPATGRRILLVEDHLDTALSLGALLEMQGYQVLLAHSFADALKHRDQVFDVLVTDIGLPDGDGLDLLRELCPAPCAAIALSGYGTDRDRQRTAAAGFVRHLVKPVDADELMRSIEEVCTQALGASA